MYPIVEATTGALFGAVMYWYGPTPLGVVRMLFGCAMIVLFVIDLQHRILPNVITVPGDGDRSGPQPASCRPGWRVVAHRRRWSAAACCSRIGEAYYRLRGVEGLGMGDVKMLAMIGAFLGWQLVLVTLIAGVVRRRGPRRGCCSRPGAAPCRRRCRSARSWPSGPPSRRWWASRSSPGIWRSIDEPQGGLLVGLTAVIAAIVVVLLFAVLRFFAATRGAKQRLRDAGSETALLSNALQEAVTKLKAQEQQMRAARARVRGAQRAHRGQPDGGAAWWWTLEGRVEILNPAAYRLLGVEPDAVGRDYRDVLASCPPLVDLVAECLATGAMAPSREIAVQNSEGHVSIWA